MVTEVSVSRAVGSARPIEGVGVGGAGRELVVGGARGVGPGAGHVDREGAVDADGAGLRHEGGGAVDVADGSVPEVEMSAAALVSVRLRTSAESTAASFCAFTWTTSVKFSVVFLK